MLKLENVKPEEMPEVLRVAQRLYAEDQTQIEQAQRRREIVDAAEEVGIPEEYLERAAAEVQRQRAAEIRQKQEGRGRFVAIAVGLSVGVAAFVFTSWLTIAPSQAPPPPRIAEVATAVSPLPVEEFGSGAATRWTLDKNPETRAEVVFENAAGRQGVARIEVERLGGREPRANLEGLQAPPSLSGRREIKFDAQGRGLRYVRVDLEASPTERWRSRNLPLTPEWSTQTVPLDGLEYQTRSSPSAPWKVQRYRPPEGVKNLSFKLGHYVNDAGTSGEVTLDNVRFE